MKKPRKQAHLLDVDEPLLGYHELQMRCGVVLRNAEPIFMLTDDLEMVFMYLGTCKDCLDAKPTETEKRRYVYGLIEGQEQRMQEVA